MQAQLQGLQGRIQADTQVVVGLRDLVSELLHYTDIAVNVFKRDQQWREVVKVCVCVCVVSRRVWIFCMLHWQTICTCVITTPHKHMYHVFPPPCMVQHTAPPAIT